MPRVPPRAYFAFATTSLALAVGATLTVFTIVNALWLEPPPYPEPDRMVTLVGEAGDVDPAYYRIDTLYSARWSVFEAVAGQVVTSGRMAGSRPRVVIDSVGRELETLAVTARYFSLFGQSIRGRDFAPADNRGGAEPVGIISDRLWTRVFARRMETIGAVVAARPFPIRIIGVAPPGFHGARRGERADLWIPSNLIPRLTTGVSANQAETVPMLVFARLRPGQTPSEARERLLQTLPDERSRMMLLGVQVVPLDRVFGTSESRAVVIREGGAATVVAGLAGLVLVAGCTTLMALVLVHYERRRRELAVRVALGASRARLVRELSLELTSIAAAGGIGALLLSVWSLRGLPALSLPGGVDLDRLDLSIDARVMLAALTTTVATLAAAALVPIRRFTRAEIATDLIASSSTPPRSSHRLRQSLLAVHVAATNVVLVAAGLFVRAVISGFGAGPGFDVDRTAYATVQVVPYASTLEEVKRQMTVGSERGRRIRERLLTLPGVEVVASGGAPIGSDAAEALLNPTQLETSGGRRELKVGVYMASAELLPALGVPLLAGRSLTRDDATARPAPAIVTSSLARTLWPNDDPLGQIVSLGGRFGRVTVVGIARDFAYGSLTNGAVGVIVRATSFEPGVEQMLVIRTGRPDLQVAAIRRIVEEVAPDAPRVAITTGREMVARDLGRQRLGAWFFSGFGLVALLLGAGGVFGLVAYLAESRRREFGVRIALGATPRDLVCRGVAAGLIPVALGTVIGLLCAAIVARVFVSLLPGLSTLDPPTHAAVALLMILCALASGLAAALRLHRLEPGDALRAE